MTLKSKLILLLFAFTLIPLVLFGAVVFSQARNILQTVRTAQLDTIADLKKDKIETFFQEREADVRSAQDFRNIRTNLPVLSAHAADRSAPAYVQAKKALDDQMKTFQESYGYLDVMLLDPLGKVVYASNDEHSVVQLDKPLLNGKFFEEGKKGIYFTDVFFGTEGGGRVEMIGIAPIRDLHGAFAGAVALEIDMGPIFKFIQDATGLGTTGEALIARKEGNETLFLSPLQHEPNAALKKVVSLEEKTGVPAIKAAQGENGSGITYDYHGEEVLAAWRYIPSLRWGLVAKIDASEVFAPVRKLRTLVISVGIFIVFIGALAALAIARTTTGPILSLQKGAEAIAAGDLSHRVGTLAQDEVGRLSRAFDAMTEALAFDRAGREKAEMEVRKLNDDLRNHVVQLEESNKELDAFSYSVSHDLRSPLRSIDGFSLALLEDYAGKLDPGGRDYLERVRRATQRMSQLIDDLLKLSRVARFEMKRERVDLGPLANAIARQLKQNHPERSVDFITADGLIAYGDERLLTIMLENLFANAWKFSEKRPRTVIELGAIDCGSRNAECGMENRKSESNSEVRNPRSEMVFFVKDNGVGFDMAYADKLFNPFQRLHRQAEFAGTGIGLATVKRIINRHGGRVWIESTVDAGTTVFFTLG